MNEPNYNETVVIPLLQKKFQELTNENLVLEANLLVEKERNAFLQKELIRLRGESPPKRKRKDEPQVDGSTF
jgi:hypothetical protein